MASVSNSPVRISDAQEAIAQRHEHTQAQVDAMNSGITAEKLTDMELPGNLMVNIPMTEDDYTIRKDLQIATITTDQEIAARFSNWMQMLHEPYYIGMGGPEIGPTIQSDGALFSQYNTMNWVLTPIPTEITDMLVVYSGVNVQNWQWEWNVSAPVTIDSVDPFTTLDGLETHIIRGHFFTATLGNRVNIEIGIGVKFNLERDGNYTSAESADQRLSSVRIYFESDTQNEAIGLQHMDILGEPTTNHFRSGTKHYIDFKEPLPDSALINLSLMVDVEAWAPQFENWWGINRPLHFKYSALANMMPIGATVLNSTPQVDEVLIAIIGGISTTTKIVVNKDNLSLTFVEMSIKEQMWFGFPVETNVTIENVNISKIMLLKDMQ